MRGRGRSGPRGTGQARIWVGRGGRGRRCSSKLVAKTPTISRHDMKPETSRLGVRCLRGTIIRLANHVWYETRQSSMLTHRCADPSQSLVSGPGSFLVLPKATRELVTTVSWLFVVRTARVGRRQRRRQHWHWARGQTAGVGVGTGFPSSPSTVLFRSSFYFINPRITETTEADGRSNGRARTLELSPLHRGQLGRCCSRVKGRWHVAAGNAIPSTSLDFMTRSLLQPQSLAASSPSFRLRHRCVGLAKAISQASDLNPHTLYPPPLLPFLGLQTLIRFDFDLTVSSLRSFLGLV